MKILIFSDNLEMFEFFIQKVMPLQQHKMTFDYACSPQSPVMKSAFPAREILMRDDYLKLIEYDLIISIHCKQLFPADLVKRVRCINVHPGYNPETRGWYPQVFAILNNLKAGVTIHEMDEHLDNGRILVREEVEKSIADTSYSLYRKLISKEKKILLKCFPALIRHEMDFISHEGDKNNLFLKKDFKNLCEIDLNSRGTFLEFYNLLRALSFENYDNAFFIDPSSGEKVFVSLNTKTTSKN